MPRSYCSSSMYPLTSRRQSHGRSAEMSSACWRIVVVQLCVNALYHAGVRASSLMRRM